MLTGLLSGPPLPRAGVERHVDVSGKRHAVVSERRHEVSVTTTSGCQHTDGPTPCHGLAWLWGRKPSNPLALPYPPMSNLRSTSICAGQGRCHPGGRAVVLAGVPAECEHGACGGIRPARRHEFPHGSQQPARQRGHGNESQWGAHLEELGEASQHPARQRGHRSGGSRLEPPPRMIRAESEPVVHPPSGTADHQNLANHRLVPRPA
jgi:hypothetical protein